MAHALIASPFLGGHLLLKPGARTGARISADHFEDLRRAATGGEPLPTWAVQTAADGNAGGRSQPTVPEARSWRPPCRSAGKASRSGYWTSARPDLGHLFLRSFVRAHAPDDLASVVLLSDAPEGPAAPNQRSGRRETPGGQVRGTIKCNPLKAIPGVSGPLDLTTARLTHDQRRTP